MNYPRKEKRPVGLKAVDIIQMLYLCDAGFASLSRTERHEKGTGDRQRRFDRPYFGRDPGIVCKSS